MLAGLNNGNVVTPAKGYLATFTYRVAVDAVGTFVVDVLHNAANQDQTYLISEFSDVIEVSSTTPAAIVVTPGPSRSIR